MSRPIGKYHEENLLAAFRKAGALRDEMIDMDFTDNGGAIHSAERILGLYGLRLNYPKLTHINNLKHQPDAEFSVAAKAAHERGERVLIEHVSPHRALTINVIDLVREGASDDAVKEYVRANFRLVLLTPEETTRLNKHNRSRMTVDRLGEAGIVLAPKA